MRGPERVGWRRDGAEGRFLRKILGIKGRMITQNTAAKKIKSTNPWLVFLMPGKDSLHQNWKEDYRQYGFDLCILQYDVNHEFTDENSKNATYLIKRPGKRFKLISYFMKDHPEVLDKYEHFFILDDDIDTDPIQINKLLTTCKRYHFDLAQPGLAEGSYIAHPPTARDPNTRFRLSPSVECMVPVFSQRAFRATQDDIHLLPCGIGWGMEVAWELNFHAGEGRSIWGGRIGMIDDVYFKHTRIQQYGTGTGVYSNGGRDGAWGDLNTLKQKYGSRWKELDLSTRVYIQKKQK